MLLFMFMTALGIMVTPFDAFSTNKNNAVETVKFVGICT